MDVQTFHNHDGLSAGKAIREEHPGTKVLIVTSLIDPKVLERAKTGCADSLWYKDHGEDEIRDVIHRTLNGEHVFPDVTPDVELNWITSGEISPRQLEMLRLYICGMSYSEIAKEMNCTTSGVRWKDVYKRQALGIMMAGLVCTNVYALDNKDVVGTWYANSLSMDGMNEFHPNAIMMEMSMEINEDGKGKVTTSSESEEADVDDFEWKIDGDNIVITASDDEVMEGTYEDGKITISMDGMTVTLGQEKERCV